MASHGDPSEESSTLTEKLRRGDLSVPECPSREVLKDVTSLWAVLVLIALRDGRHRYGELRRKARGISEKMLVQTLKALEADGFVERVSYPVVPPHVEYSLTQLGVGVAAQVASLADWVEQNMPAIAQAQQLSGLKSAG